MIITLSQQATKDIKRLGKKYPKINNDVEEFKAELLNSKEAIGDRMQRVEGLEIYKARIKNSSSQRGKRGGFRVIYYIMRKKDEIEILTIYDKVEQADVSSEFTKPTKLKQG